MAAKKKKIFEDLDQQYTLAMNANQNMPSSPSSLNLICFASLPSPLYFPRESDYSEFPGKSQLAACIDFLPVAIKVVTLYSDKLPIAQTPYFSSSTDQFSFSAFPDPHSTGYLVNFVCDLVAVFKIRVDFYRIRLSSSFLSQA
jgi:hypothetical protein